MKTIGVLSDTHGRLDERCYAALADCDAIIHAGDIGDPKILKELETLAPVYAVLGNNDFPSDYPSSVEMFAQPIIENVRFLVSHYPRDVRFTAFGAAGIEPGDPIPRICIHGHTHVPRIIAGHEASPSDYILCPGSASRPRQGNPRTIAKIQVENGHIQDIHIETLDGKRLDGVIEH